MRTVSCLFLTLFLLLSAISCSSTDKKKSLGVSREKAGDETIFSFEDIILFYNDAKGYILLDLLYLEKADTFIVRFTNKNDPEVVLESGVISTGDTTVDLVKVEREEKKKKQSGKRDKKKKALLKPMPTENLFTISRSGLLTIIESDQPVNIHLSGRTKKNPRELYEYTIDLDPGDVKLFRDFYDAFTGDDKDTGVNDE